MILDVFEYNQHFVAMMNIINSSRLSPPKSGHMHHIIPKCWFKMKHLPIDNSEANLVLLSYEDHVKVHKLAYMCAKSSIFKGRMAYAYHRLTQGDVVSNDCFKGEKCAMYGKHHSEESRKKMSEARKRHTVSEVWRRSKSESMKGEKNPFYGKHHSEEVRKKMSESRRGKKRGPYKKRIK